MKLTIQRILQKLLGFKTYLKVFSVFKITTLDWDEEESDFFHFVSLMPEDGVVFDIGANIGIMSVHLAKRVSKGKVIAVEPLPDNFEVLQKVCALYKMENVVFYNCALGETNTTAEIILPIESDVKRQGLSHMVHESIPLPKHGEKYTVEQRTLDSLVEELNLPVAGIKMDVENFEYFVLKGGMKSIQHFKPIIYCELWDNDNRRKCLELMKELQYKVMVLGEEHLVDYDPEVHKTQNFFFIP